MIGHRESGFLFATLFALAAAAVPAHADVPDPGRSRIRWSAPPTPCGYLFGAAAGGDVLTLDITLLDAFDQAIPGCSVAVSTDPTTGTLAFCDCCAGPVVGVSDADGAVLSVVGESIGGRGALSVSVTALCSGSLEIAAKTIQFTSSDLVGACAPPDIFSLGIWAIGLPPGYAVASDYNCNAIVDVYDLAFWARGLGRDCACPGP